MTSTTRCARRPRRSSFPLLQPVRPSDRQGDRRPRGRARRRMGTLRGSGCWSHPVSADGVLDQGGRVAAGQAAAGPTWTAGSCTPEPAPRPSLVLRRRWRMEGSAVCQHAAGPGRRAGGRPDTRERRRWTPGRPWRPAMADREQGAELRGGGPGRGAAARHASSAPSTHRSRPARRRRRHRTSPSPGSASERTKSRSLLPARQPPRPSGQGRSWRRVAGRRRTRHLRRARPPPQPASELGCGRWAPSGRGSAPAGSRPWSARRWRRGAPRRRAGQDHGRDQAEAAGVGGEQAAARRGADGGGSRCGEAPGSWSVARSTGRGASCCIAGAIVRMLQEALARATADVGCSGRTGRRSNWTRYRTRAPGSGEERGAACSQDRRGRRRRTPGRRRSSVVEGQLRRVGSRVVAGDEDRRIDERADVLPDAARAEPAHDRERAAPPPCPRPAPPAPDRRTRTRG